MSAEIALVTASVASNVVLLYAVLVQRYRQRAAAVARCSACPFVTTQVPGAARIPLPASVYDEPPTVLLARAS